MIAVTARVLFITDPLCAWCWATLPEIGKARALLEDQVTFDLIMGGMQVGPAAGLVEFEIKKLRTLWQEIQDLTGQEFSAKIPSDFVYHSEIACRAVEIARARDGQPPWDFFHSLQSAFYQQGRDINRLDVLTELLSMNETEVGAKLHAGEYIDSVRANFALTSSLSAHALPNLHMDTGEGYKLVAGGYITAEFLVPAIEERLAAD